MTVKITSDLTMSCMQDNSTYFGTKVMPSKEQGIVITMKAVIQDHCLFRSSSKIWWAVEKIPSKMYFPVSS